MRHKTIARAPFYANVYTALLKHNAKIKIKLNKKRFYDFASMAGKCLTPPLFEGFWGFEPLKIL